MSMRSVDGGVMPLTMGQHYELTKVLRNGEDTATEMIKLGHSQAKITRYLELRSKEKTRAKQTKE